jgi:ATP-dependent DNA ligase
VIGYSGLNPYLRLMPQFEFCLPTVGKAVSAADDWLHEIKYDGYRLRLERDGDRVRLITRGGTTGPTATRGSSRRRSRTASSSS